VVCEARLRQRTKSKRLVAANRKVRMKWLDPAAAGAKGEEKLAMCRRSEDVEAD
jgi:hypothetical protein